MSCRSILRRLGILSRISHADIDAATTENIERSLIENGKAVERIKASSATVEGSSGRLRESIRRVSSSAFADLEHSIGGHRGQHS